MQKNKVLFILKRKDGYDDIKDSNIGMSTGLYNSALFMSDMLNESGVKSKVVVVVDNNSIDGEVTKYKPTHVIVEALWVVPSKFQVLQKLHPKVKWIIRLHSEIPFLANEGSAMNWLGDYVYFENVYLSMNSPKTNNDIIDFIRDRTGWTDIQAKNKVIYLPNYYPQDYIQKELDKTKEVIDIGCFGAIRPMKNQLIQAMAAVKFANSIGKKLRFHINHGRVEQRGDSVYKNLQSYFSHISDSGHELVRHDWCPRDEFLKICSEMDMGMQVSFSETFNIVAADLTSQGVPVVSSKELPWINPIFISKPTYLNSIYWKLLLTYWFSKFNLKSNQYLLKKYTNKTRKIWLKYFTHKK
jgi:hypothetical protein